MWFGESVALGHRRLAVVDLTDGGAQPMSTPDGRFTIVYNGEIYNDHEIRRDLTAVGVRFRSTCDTETVLQALATWSVRSERRGR